MSLGTPFIPLARAERRTFQISPEGQGVERAEDRRHRRGFQKSHTLWPGPKDKGGAAGKTQGEGSRQAARDRPWKGLTHLSLHHCPLQAGVRLDLSGRVHRAAVACLAEGNIYYSLGNPVERLRRTQW